MHIGVVLRQMLLFLSLFCAISVTLFLLPGCEEGDIRLVSMNDPLGGHVEVCYDSVWGRVCSSGWNNLDAAIACTQLGYNSLGMTSLRNYSSLRICYIAKCSGLFNSIINDSIIYYVF